MKTNEQQDAQILVAHLFRHQSGKIIASLAKTFGARHLDLVEDVVQDALVKALQRWPFDGIPENPAGWLTTVAKNCALDSLRRDSTFAHKVSELEQWLVQLSPSGDQAARSEMDDQLALILMCSHPALAVECQVALTLKLACGFSTAEIARAFLTPEPTIAQRLVRAKRQIREQNILIDLPSIDLMPKRLETVLRVIYFLFNEGYAATAGRSLIRTDLCDEAIRLCTVILRYGLRPPAVHALLALMFFQAARFPARTDDDGTLTILDKQDRSKWDQRLISAGLRHLARSADGPSLTSYHLQAEIAAIHATARDAADTDWVKIAALYEQLYRLEPTPVVALNRAIARSRFEGAAAGLRALEEISSSPSLRDYHLLSAVRAELWKQLGEYDRAADEYRAALSCSCSEPEHRFLESQLELVSCNASEIELQGTDRTAGT